jgi:hypothetical protein
MGKHKYSSRIARIALITDLLTREIIAALYGGGGRDGTSSASSALESNGDQVTTGERRFQMVVVDKLVNVGPIADMTYGEPAFADVSVIYNHKFP